MDANVFPNFLSEFSPSAHFLASCWECFPLTKLNKFLSVNVQCNNYYNHILYICIGNSMNCSDIWHKCHEWYLCQISHTNHAIICLHYYPQ